MKSSNEKSITVEYQLGGEHVKETLSGLAVGIRPDADFSEFVVIYADARTLRIHKNAVVAIDMLTPATA